MKFLIVLSALLALSAAVPVNMSLEQIDAALSNPNTDPALIPILEHAMNQIMDALISGHQVESVMVDLPINAEIAGVTPAPAASSPLVQVVVNVNKQQQQVHEIPIGNPVNVIAINPPRN